MYIEEDMNNIEDIRRMRELEELLDYHSRKYYIDNAPEISDVIDSDVCSDLVSCRISTDNYKAGKMVGEAVLSGKEDKLLVGIVNFAGHSEKSN